MTISNDPRCNPTIVRALVNDGHFYQMEYKNQTNLLFYILLKLYQAGIHDQQLNNVYYQLVKHMEPLIMPKTSKLQNKIKQNEWQEYLGDSDMYSEYLKFFRCQLLCHGLENVMDHYFYKSPLSQSIGSYRLPIIHLALGMQYKLEEVISQALAYLAASYQDASFLYHQPRQLEGGYLNAHQILVDQVRVDPRFASFHTGQDHLKNIYRNILKSTKELLKTYVYLWKRPACANDALEELCVLAAHMMMKPVRHGLRKHYVDLGTGGVLLNTMIAVHVLYPNNSCPIEIVLVQFLNLICYYIAQGRPKILPYSRYNLTNYRHTSHYSKIEKAMTSDVDTNMMTTAFALQEAQAYSTHPIYQRVLSFL